jgi:hypothetical protein
MFKLWLICTKCMEKELGVRDLTALLPKVVMMVEKSEAATPQGLANSLETMVFGYTAGKTIGDDATDLYHQLEAVRDDAKAGKSESLDAFRSLYQTHYS